MKRNFDKFFGNRNMMKVLSFLLAVVAWLMVVYSIDSTTETVIRNVPVDVTAQEEANLRPLNLNVVEEESILVDVRIKGNQGVLGGIRASDLNVVANLSGITQKGTYDNISLSCTDRNSAGATGRRFTVVDINPPVISLQVERMVSKYFTIKFDVDGMRIPEDYVASETTVSPREVMITGPESKVSRIDHASVSAQFTEPLTKNTTKNSQIALYDSEGVELGLESLTLTPETADIIVPVLKRKSLPVRVDFVGYPRDFPIDELEYTLSAEAVNVAGPEAELDARQDLPIGHVNLSEVGLDFVQVFEVSLPSGFVNQDNVNTISVEVDTSGMTEANFVVKNIQAVNVPVNYDVRIDTVQLAGVHMIGRSEIMENLSAEDLVAEIDISEREVSPGPYNLPVKIMAPGKGLVWAQGEYTAVVTIQEK